MAKIRYTYLAKGKYPRFRHAKTGDVALPDMLAGKPLDEQSPEFIARYGALVHRVKNNPKTDTQSFAWLSRKYQNSVEFSALAGRTQEDYAKTLELMCDTLGPEPYKFLSRRVIKALRDKYAATPRKAHKIKQMASRLYSWADEMEYVPEGFNPAKGIKEIKRKKNGYQPWRDSELAQALTDPDTHIEAPLMIGLYTGQRNKDVAEMDWKQYDGPTIRVRQSKGGELIDIPTHPVLRKYLDRIKPELAVGPICRSAGNRPYNSNSLGTALRVYLHGIGIYNRSMHGLRFTMAANLNDAGCSAAQVQAILGHKTYEMAMLYMTRKQNAQQAINALENIA